MSNTLQRDIEIEPQAIEAIDFNEVIRIGRATDRIVVVGETGVAEQVRHDELVSASGIYQRLHEAQFSR